MLHMKETRTTDSRSAEDKGVRKDLTRTIYGNENEEKMI